MTKEKENKNLLICDSCNGSGRLENGQPCRDCSGLGIVSLAGRYAYYWGIEPSMAIIGLNRVKRGADLAVNLISYLISFGGILAGAAWAYQNLMDKPSGAGLEQFLKKDPLLLFFWIGIACGMFVFYRLSEELRRSEKIGPQSYGGDASDENAVPGWPDLAKLPKKQKIDVARFYQVPLLKIFDDAFLLTGKLRHSSFTVKHFFLCLMRDLEVRSMLVRLDIQEKDLAKRIKNQISGMACDKKFFSNPAVDNRLRSALISGFLLARDLGEQRVNAINLVYACVSADKELEEIFYDYEVDLDKIYSITRWFRINERLAEAYKAYRTMSYYKPSTAMNRSYTAIATPTLDYFGIDLTIYAKYGRLDFCVAREEEIAKVFDIIESGHGGVVLVGETGVGKRTIISGIAQLMAEEYVPEILKDKRLVEIDLARLMSGADPSEAEERLLSAIDEAGRSGNVILAINDIETMLGVTSGSEQSLDLSDVLVRSVEDGNIICIATASASNYAQFIEGKSLGSCFMKVEVSEPETNQAIMMISSKIGPLEAKNRVYFSYNALEEAIHLSKKYIHDKYLPAKAIQLLEIVSTSMGKRKRQFITKDDVAQVVSEITHIPVQKADENESELLLNLEDKIHEQMVDQEEAVNILAASLRRARAQLTEGKRPIANFLFLGPTGVGKTELAKTVSRIYFGSEKNMIRLDMSEYQHPDSISKMIGDSDGGLGFLTEAVRKTPFSLVLLDEFEKAYKDILNLFLQVMEDGRLTDGQGRTVDFTNTIIIATSNVGAVFIQDRMKAGASAETIKKDLVDNELNKYLRPELINRFDGVIVFKPLSIQDVRSIAKLMLKAAGKVLEEKGMFLECDDGGIETLAAEGFDPEFGARPLRRLIQERVENVIANKILAGELKRRDTVLIDSNAQITIKKGRKL